MEELIRDVARFADIEIECGRVLDKAKRLPEYVFRVPFARYCALEYGSVMKQSFADVLLQLSNIYGDSAISYLSIEPDPYEYYYKTLGFFGVACFDPKTIKQRYIEVMRRSGEADSFFARGGDVGAFYGSSMQWAMFCDRISWELAVLGVAEDLPHNVEAHIRALNPVQLASYISSQYCHAPETASQFVRTFLTNYPISKGLRG